MPYGLATSAQRITSHQYRCPPRLSPNVHEIREIILYIYAVVAVVVAFARGMRVISQSNQERAQDANRPGLLYGAYFGWNGPDIVGKPK
jgi:hypothetical protein